MCPHDLVPDVTFSFSLSFSFTNDDKKQDQLVGVSCCRCCVVAHLILQNNVESVDNTGKVLQAIVSKGSVMCDSWKVKGKKEGKESLHPEW